MGEFVLTQLKRNIKGWDLGFTVGIIIITSVTILMSQPKSVLSLILVTIRDRNGNSHMGRKCLCSFSILHFGTGKIHQWQAVAVVVVVVVVRPTIAILLLNPCILGSHPRGLHQVFINRPNKAIRTVLDLLGQVS